MPMTSSPLESKILPKFPLKAPNTEYISFHSKPFIEYLLCIELCIKYEEYRKKKNRNTVLDTHEILVWVGSGRMINQDP